MLTRLRTTCCRSKFDLVDDQTGERQPYCRRCGHYRVVPSVVDGFTESTLVGGDIVDWAIAPGGGGLVVVGWRATGDVVLVSPRESGLSFVAHAQPYQLRLVKAAEE